MSGDTRKRRGSVNIDKNKMKKGRLYSIAVKPKPVKKYGHFLKALQEQRIEDHQVLTEKVAVKLQKSEAEEAAKGVEPEPVHSGLEVIQPRVDGQAPVHYEPEDLEDLESKLDGLRESRRKLMWLLEQIKILETTRG